MTGPRFIVRPVRAPGRALRTSWQVYDLAAHEFVGIPYAKQRSAERYCDRRNTFLLIQAAKYRKAKDNG